MKVSISEFLPLANKIAREFGNIPHLSHAEIDLAAQEALVHAARKLRPRAKEKNT